MPTELPQDCMEVGQYRLLFVMSKSQGLDVEAEQLHEMQVDCLASQGIEYKDWVNSLSM